MTTILAVIALASPQELRAPSTPLVAKAVYLRPSLMTPATPQAAIDEVLGSQGTSAIALFTGDRLREPAIPQSTVRVTQGTKPKPPASIEDKLVDVVCTNTDVNGVLALLSASTKTNMVLVSPAEAKLTLRLKQVKLIDAVRHICAVAGIAHLKVGDAYLFGDAERIRNAYPKEWARAYPPAKIEAPPHVEPPKVDPPKVEVEDPIVTRVVSVSYTDTAKLADMLAALFKDQDLIAVAGPGASSPTLGDRDTSGSTGINQGVIQSEGAKSKTLVLRGPESVVKSAAAAVADLDLPGAQVKISVSIHDVNDTALRELGVSWNIGGTTFQEKTPQGINFGGFNRTPFNFGATIRALETQDKAQLLASPEVTVLDNERAFVLIGNKLNLPKFDGYDANKIPIYSTSEYRVGIYLQVAASVAADGTITLAIYPQVSTVVKTTEINGASYPDIATREAQTTLRVKTGETIVIGGLLRNEELEQLEQVPILSKIPLFGELFKRRKKTRSSSQVVISLTPTLVLPDKQ